MLTHLSSLYASVCSAGRPTITTAALQQDHRRVLWSLFFADGWGWDFRIRGIGAQLSDEEIWSFGNGGERGRGRGRGRSALVGGGPRCGRRRGFPSLTILHVVYVSGGVYWSYDVDSLIGCYDFDRDLFQVVEWPKMSSAWKRKILGVLDGAVSGLPQWWPRGALWLEHAGLEAIEGGSLWSTIWSPRVGALRAFSGTTTICNSEALKCSSSRPWIGFVWSSASDGGEAASMNKNRVLIVFGLDPMLFLLEC